ncbi:PIG-L deacetylase family protein [Gordonia hydrophobica]|uniref:PIG-L family deacetylase n=1 Tax=Gordonia hydrophobica TaxID=40516 RepID=A0ABZ2U2A8_9ACTN|nr:PIG-L family deacetylase [Gordonia hydrophobica]MBM7366908.1 LmbE family N-acetylglucosaminyl deacetylase [Gordonia hydrophobica]
MTPATFPTDWSTALVLVAHPDDPEYGMAAAVARWTSEGKHVVYGLATSGEVGIEGMDAAEAGPLREAEQIASAAVVGVDDVEFWGFPDSQVFNSPELRAKIREVIQRVDPDVIACTYGGPSWGEGKPPNQRDHIEFAAAVIDAYDELPDARSTVFWNGPNPTHAVDVTGFTEKAVESLTCHQVYLEVLDPATPVQAQARQQVEWSTQPIDGFDAARASGFEQIRPTE